MALGYCRLSVRLASLLISLGVMITSSFGSTVRPARTILTAGPSVWPFALRILIWIYSNFVITIPGIWKNPGAVYPIFRDIHIPGLFDDLVITNSGVLKNHGMYFMLIFGMNSLMLHCI